MIPPDYAHSFISSSTCLSLVFVSFRVWCVCVCLCDCIYVHKLVCVVQNMRIVFSLFRSTNETHFLLLFIYRTNKTTLRQWNGTSTNRFGGTFIMLDFPLLIFHGNVSRIVCVLFLFDRKWRHEANKLIRKLEPGIFFLCPLCSTLTWARLFNNNIQ